MPVSAIKGNPYSIARLKGRDLPAPGSKLRALYDFLYENRGKPVLSSVAYDKSTASARRRVSDLEDYYGCDIRRKGCAQQATIMLAGELIGNVYVDYVAERLAMERGQDVGEQLRQSEPCCCA